MILIDRDKQKQDLVLTLTEKTTVSEPEYFLHLINDADRSEFNIDLNDAFVSTNSRYDHYSLDTSNFSEMPDGYYTYLVHQIGIDSAAVESGKLLIKGSADDVQIITPIRTEEYLIYK
ncbi:hypothetical protein [Mucilaginibacter psychrotolerans]|uniref:Uncharacterized protein n=1 Tax=Mucilaginibacter psychrotolerans TaxID=1524096 RepID=A0A4Y8S7M1_9SPHI|nr:hypothetical protein [Mucilaginibacter psychrotolerans]TFF34384.1 hypothetical protein E2R66_22175 [Mucilaginibacter psychrotolerans]